MKKIYKATNKINGKVYIGQTSQKLKDRIDGHFKTKNCQYFHNAILKHGIENFEWEILFEADVEQKKLDEKEIEYIEKYRSSEKEFGYNLQLGGRGGKFNDVARKKMSDSAKKYFNNEENRKRHGEIQKKRYENFEERIKHSRAHGGKPFYGRNEKEIKLFQTQSEAAKYLGDIEQSNINSALRGKSKHIMGWMFSYEYIEKYISKEERMIKIKEEKNIKKKEKENLKKEKRAFYAVKDNVSLCFYNIKDAEDFLKISLKNFSFVIKKKRNHIKGWKFFMKYKENGEINENINFG